MNRERKFNEIQIYNIFKLKKIIINVYINNKIFYSFSIIIR